MCAAISFGFWKCSTDSLNISNEVTKSKTHCPTLIRIPEEVVQVEVAETRADDLMFQRKQDRDQSEHDGECVEEYMHRVAYDAQRFDLKAVEELKEAECDICAYYSTLEGRILDGESFSLVYIYSLTSDWLKPRHNGLLKNFVM